MNSNHAAIGGYFELELMSGVRQGEWHSNALRFQSARAACLALLLEYRPTRVWVPWYICDSMLEPLQMANVSVTRYALDNTLSIKDDIKLGRDEWLVYVNYFGVCRTQVENILKQFPHNQVVIDNSQAFFSPPLDCLGTIYSPRKFFGVPDGGYLVTSASISEPNEEDNGSLQRCSHLLKRLGMEPEAGYSDYQQAERSLTEQYPKRMSKLTQRLLEQIDYSAICARRDENFATFHSALRDMNQLSLTPKNGTGPLCYPFWKDLQGIREKLILQRIFIPTYWPEVSHNSTAVPDFENRFSQECIPLPCDQRYSKKEINRIISYLLSSQTA